MIGGKVWFTIDIMGERQLDRTFMGLMEEMKDLSPFFQFIADDFSATVERKFAAEGAIDGEPKWDDLSAAYAKRKEAAYPGKGILEATGTMRQAATHPDVEIGPKQLTITIDSDYAGYHQSPDPRAILPRRAFASLTADQKRRWMSKLREQVKARNP